MRACALVVAIAACGHSDRAPAPVVLPVEIGSGVDPRLTVELREATYAPSSLQVLGLVTNHGDVTYIGVTVEIELLDARGAKVGSLDLEPVGFSLDKLGWLYPGFGVPIWNSQIWSGEWKPPARLRARIANAEVERGEPPPPPPPLRDVPVTAVKPAPPSTRLAIQMVWGGDPLGGTDLQPADPNAGFVPFDVELAITNAGSTAIAGADVAAVFEDSAGKEIDRLSLDASFRPAMRPGDKRLVGRAHGVHPYARWHVELGDIRLATDRS